MSESLTDIQTKTRQLLAIELLELSTDPEIIPQDLDEQLKVKITSLQSVLK